MVFQLKHYKKEVFETIFLLLFHSNVSATYRFVYSYTKMFNLDDITNKNNEDHNKKWLYIPDHPYRMLIFRGSESGKTYALLNLIAEQNSDNLIDNIYLCAKDLNELKYQFLIKKRKDVGVKHINEPKAFIEHLKNINDVYNVINDYNPTRKKF